MTTQEQSDLRIFYLMIMGKTTGSLPFWIRYWYQLSETAAVGTWSAVALLTQ